MARQLERFENLVALYLTRAEEKGGKPILWAKRDGAWRSISWAEAARQVAALAFSQKRFGLQPVMAENMLEFRMRLGMVEIDIEVLAQPGARRVVVRRFRHAP